MRWGPLAHIFMFGDYERDRWVAEQARRLPAGSKVLDVGAGPCRYRTLFSHCDYKTQDFCQYEGSSIGPLADMGKWAYGKIDYVCDATSIPVPDGSFDVVCCTEVLEHVPEPIRAVQEMARILKPGGKLLLTAPMGSFLHQEPFHFYGGYTPHWYRKFLPEAGMEVVSIEPNRGLFSWFGQEAQRFSAFIDPRRTLKTGWCWPFLTLLWLVTLPFCRLLFPLVGQSLDELGLGQVATVGYHVVAIKR